MAACSAEDPKDDQPRRATRCSLINSYDSNGSGAIDPLMYSGKQQFLIEANLLVKISAAESTLSACIRLESLT